MATTDTAPPTHPHEINYVAKLNEALRSIKKDYDTKTNNLEAQVKNLKDIETSDAGTLKNYNSLVKEGLWDYEILRQINEDIVQIDLKVQNVSTLATASSADATDTAVKTAAAAKAIDTAHFSVAKLTSFVASIHAKLNTEEKGSPLAKLCAAAFEDTQIAAVSAEKVTVAVVIATEDIAKSHSASVASVVTQAELESKALADSFASDMLAAQTNAVSTYQQSLDEFKTLSGDIINHTNATKENISTKLIGGTGDFAFLYKEIIPKHRNNKPQTESDLVDKYIDEAAEEKNLPPAKSK